MSRGNPLVQYLVIKNGSTSALAVDLWTLVASGKWNSYAQFSRHIVSGKFGKCQEGDLTVRRNSIFAVVVKRHQNTEGRVRLDLLHNSAATSHGKKYDKRATAALCQDTCKNSNSKHCVNHSHVVSHEHDLKCGKMYSERLPSQPSLAQIAFGCDQSSILRVEFGIIIVSSLKANLLEMIGAYRLTVSLCAALGWGLVRQLWFENNGLGTAEVWGHGLEAA